LNQPLPIGNTRSIGAAIVFFLRYCANMSAPLLHIFAAHDHDTVTEIGHRVTGERENQRKQGIVMQPGFRNTNAFDRSRPAVPCAQCGDALSAPEWSESIDDRRVRHLWSCDGCGYEFETEVFYPSPAAKAA
jgi:hypothetical protein